MYSIVGVLYELFLCICLFVSYGLYVILFVIFYLYSAMRLIPSLPFKNNLPSRPFLLSFLCHSRFFSCVAILKTGHSNSFFSKFILNFHLAIRCLQKYSHLQLSSLRSWSITWTRSANLEGRFLSCLRVAG